MTVGKWQQANHSVVDAAAPQLPSNAALASAIYAGDRSAEQTLVTRLVPPLRLMLRVQRVPVEDCDDLLQEGLIVLLKRLRAKPLDDAENVENFLQATITNLRIGDWRRNDRRRQLLGGNSDAAMPEFELMPDVRLEVDSKCKLVREAVSGLRQARDQQLIREHYLKEVSKPELCLRLQVTEAHFDRILFNARQRLKSLLCSALGTSE